VTAANGSTAKKGSRSGKLGAGPGSVGQVDFIGIGSQKAATTWLFEHLRQHPGTRFPVGKEFHYWDVRRARGMKVREYLERFAPAKPGIKQGEITPRYCTVPTRTILAMRRRLPEVRLLTTVRNPMARVWSAAEMHRAYAGMSPGEASDTWYTDFFGSANARARSNVTEWLPNWWSVFPEDRLLIIPYDDIKSEPRAVLLRVASYLGIDPDPYLTAPDDELRTIINMRAADRQTTVPRPSLVRALQDQYADMVGPITEMIGRPELAAPWLAWDGSR
jgi:hypothetical protein